MDETILVSACLLGLNTRYNAERRSYPEVERFLESRNLIPVPVCPEQLAGFPTPRPSASFVHGDGDGLLQGEGGLCNLNGDDVTEAFIAGAREALKIARAAECRTALLKERSPSCGCRLVYRQGQLVEGRGVTAALLRNHNITVFSEEEL